MKKFTAILVITLLVCSLQFCSKKTSINTITTEELKPVLPLTPFNYLVTFPAHIQNNLLSNDNNPADNPITNAGATLGRVLFYDKQLSLDNKINCASCHKQQFSFDDTAMLSLGINGGVTTRNSMALLNLRFYKSGKMFWDEKSLTVEKQALQPIQNHLEMGLTLSLLESKVKSLSYYPALFQNAFNSSIIDSVQISKALAQFERSIVTYQSKYDDVKQGFQIFTDAESAGEQLFLNAGSPNTCAGCHTPPLFITSNPIRGFALNDNSDGGINNQNRFKSGSLRNIFTRKSLFHNGSITNIQAMLTATGTQAIPSHTIRPTEVQNMLAFLNTLTDNSIASDKKFSDPF